MNDNIIKIELSMTNKEGVTVPKIFENINTLYNDINIEFQYNENELLIIMSSKNRSSDEIEKVFWDFYNYMGILLGYFPDIKSVIIDEEKNLANILERYKVKKEYIREDFHLIEKLEEDEFIKSFEIYNNFFEIAKLQIALYNISMMEANCYSEVAITNIIQCFDGIFEKLSISKDRYQFIKSKSKIKKIKDKISKMNFKKIIRNKEQNYILKKNVVDFTNRVEFFNFDTKLRILFNHVNDFCGIFNFEKETKSEDLNYDKFIAKCKHTRNKLSHAIDIKNCFDGEESAIYMFKLIICFRILILEELGLIEKIDKRKLYTFSLSFVTRLLAYVK